MAGRHGDEMLPDFAGWKVIENGRIGQDRRGAVARCVLFFARVVPGRRRGLFQFSLIAPLKRAKTGICLAAASRLVVHFSPHSLQGVRR